jgi:hypothetical protein
MPLVIEICNKGVKIDYITLKDYLTMKKSLTV